MKLCSRGPGGGLTIDEYIAVYYFLDIEKVGSQIHKLHPGTRTEGHTIGTRQNSWSSITPPGFAAIDVLCSGVHETHSLQLEYCAIEQYEATAQQLQDG